MEVFNLPRADQLDTMNLLLSAIANRENGVFEITNWKHLQTLVRTGIHEQFIKIGDLLKANYRGKEEILEVIGINHDTPTDESPHSLTIQFRDCLENVQFDAPEALYYASSAMAPGVKVFEIDSGKYEFTTTVEIPEGGVVYLYAWTDPYTPTRARIYGADRVTILEDDITVSVSTGSANLSPVNHQQRCRYGSNNYLESNIRQWLNSDRETFQWVPQTNFDMPGTSAAYNGGGFLNIIDPDIAAVLGAVDKQVGRNTVTDDGGQDTFSDKVFLLSQVEVYGGTGSVGDVTGEEPYEYYEKLAAGPTTDAIPGRIKPLSGAPRPWWLRSPDVSSAINTRYVGSSGLVSRSRACNANGLAPACVII